MRLDWVALEGFRSYEALEWHPVDGPNVLVGPNGAGKTNLVEAIAYLGVLRSVRGAPDEALIGEGRDRAVLRGGFTTEESTVLVEIELVRRGRRRVLLDHSRPRRLADVSERVKVVTFIPEDLDVVKRGPSHRRQVLDDAAVLLWPAAQLDLAEYERALRQRNAFLRRREDDPVTLGVWDRRLSQAGAKVMARRARAGELLVPETERFYRAVAGEETEVEMTYRSSWGGRLDPQVVPSVWEELLLRALGESRAVDLERGVTTVGPHRDEPGFTIDGRDARHQGSQGEQRALALALRLGLHAAVRDHTGRVPVLVLDDVFSELDPDRSTRLAAALPPGQVFITTAHPEEVPVAGRWWRVEGGNVA